MRLLGGIIYCLFLVGCASDFSAQKKEECLHRCDNENCMSIPVCGRGKCWCEVQRW